ncbi:MAG: hypothetical protein M3O66_04405 [Verrucomicrobiota bacterium]|nr:hypothetical protein [Verrucomicrobiota bacterium]
MSDFLKGLLQIVGKDNKLAFAPHLFDASTFRFDECVQLCWCHAIFPPGVVGRFHFNWTQRNDRCAGEDADVFALHRRAQPFAEILFRVGDRESRHMGY